MKYLFIGFSDGSIQALNHLHLRSNGLQGCLGYDISRETMMLFVWDSVIVSGRMAIHRARKEIEIGETIA